MINAVAYCRYSSEKQNDGFSIEAQRRAIDEFAENNKYRIIKYYIDEAKSGTSIEHRDNFKQLLDDAKLHEFKVVIVHKFDRFARSRLDSAIAKQALKKEGVKLISVLEHLDDSPESIILESVLEGMSEYYSKNLSREVKKGMKEAARKGLVIGPLSFGYKKGENNKIVIDEDKAKVVLDVFSSYLANEPIISISERLNKDPLASSFRNKYTYHFINYLLTNKAYIGIKEFKDESIEGAYPKIVDEETFQKVQEKLEEKKHRIVLVDKGRKEMKKVIYPLSGILFDAEGHSFCGKSGNSKLGVKHYYYYCKETKKAYPKNKIDNITLKALTDFLLSDTCVKEITSLVNENIKEASNSKDLTSLKALESKYISQKNKLLDLYLNEEIEKEQYLSRKESIEIKLSEVKEKIKSSSPYPFTSVDEAVIKNCFLHLSNRIKKEVDNQYSYQLLLRSFIKWVVIDENANLMKFHLAFSNEPEVTHELSSGTPYLNLCVTYCFSQLLLDKVIINKLVVNNISSNNFSNSLRV